MELITSIAASLISFVIGILGNLVAHDLSRNSPMLCDRLIRYAAKRVGDDERERYEEQWLADLADHQGVFAQFKHSIGCVRCARKIRRQSSLITLQLCFNNPETGAISVEYRFNLKSPVFGLLKLPGGFSGYAILLYFLPYFFFKRLIAVRRLKPKAAIHFLLNWKTIRNSPNAFVFSYRDLRIDNADIRKLLKILKDLLSVIAAFAERLTKSDGKIQISTDAITAAIRSAGSEAPPLQNDRQYLA